jgi:hypothetical protein
MNKNNIFETVPNSVMKDIYADYLGSKELGCKVNSLVEYAQKLKESIGIESSMSDYIYLAQRYFFEETAYRYYSNMR